MSENPKKYVLRSIIEAAALICALDPQPHPLSRPDTHHEPCRVVPLRMERDDELSCSRASPCPGAEAGGGRDGHRPGPRRIAPQADVPGRDEALCLYVFPPLV